MTKTNDSMEILMMHYSNGRQDMDTRRTRKNGWNEVINAYMNKLPANWPFLSVVTDPRIRTSIVEKSARIINSKLRGRLVPRKDGTMEKAEIQNTILDFQWDCANDGGTMLEKTALADQFARIFGAGFALTYWDTKKDSNDVKLIDPRDISFDGAATHTRNARWIQIREFTTWEKLEARGFNVSKIKKAAKNKEIGDQQRSTSYESIVKANRGLSDRTGEYDNEKSPVVEVVTEWRNDGTFSLFLPRFGEMLEEGKSPYKHGRIPVAMLRYHPLIDDIYGETDVEHVLPLQRAINSTLCGFVDEMTIAMRPPLKISSNGVRTETIEYGPGAQWIMDNPNLVQEMQFSSNTIANFNSTYPALVAAFNTAMGDSSLGISNVKGTFDQKTATEVRSLDQQQNSRDQNNQLYLAEFLKDIMLMWLSNTKQYLFDDPTKTHHIVKIIGKEAIQELNQMKLDESVVPPYAMDQIAQTVEQNPEGVTDTNLSQIMADVAVPTKPVVLNPNEVNPDNFQIKHKLEAVGPNEADLYVTPEDFEGDYDYIPDVQSMSLGAGEMQKQARQQMVTLITNPVVNQMLMQSGEVFDIKDLIIDIAEDAGMKDAEGKFKPLQIQQPNGQQPNQGPGQQAPGPGAIPGGPGAIGGLPDLSQAVPGQPSPGGLPTAPGL